MVDILGTLDEKIENLEEINSKLQSYCIAQYQLLFSDVERVPLSNIATITMGQSPAGSTLNEQDGVIFYQGRTDFGFRYPTVRLFTTAPPVLVVLKPTPPPWSLLSTTVSPTSTPFT